MKKCNYILALMVLLLLTACNNDDDAQEEQMSVEQQIENFVTPELLESLEDLGFVFRDGDEIPDIMGNFLISPNELLSTNVPNDFSQPGQLFGDLSINVISQNNDENSFVAEIDDSGIVEIVEETFLSGTGNEFSAYVRTNFESQEIEGVFLRAFSGIVTEDGIQEAQTAILVLDKTGDDDNTSFIGIGEGRLFIDSDGLAERIAGRSFENQTEKRDKPLFMLAQAN